MLISVSFIFFSKEPKIENLQKLELQNNQGSIKLILVLVLLVLYWMVNKVAGTRIFEIADFFGSQLVFDMPKSVWSAANAFFIVPVSLVLVISWSYYYTNQFRKFAVCFMVGAFAYGLLLIIPDIPTESYVSIYLVSIFLLTIAELFVSPVALSAITRYSNPKYLTIIISIIFIPLKLIHYIPDSFSDHIYGSNVILISSCSGFMALIGIGLIIYLRVKKYGSKF